MAGHIITGRRLSTDFFVLMIALSVGFKPVYGIFFSLQIDTYFDTLAVIF
jgi:hypothetical protein